MAFVRVKRRASDEPMNVLLVAAKRLKTEDEEPQTNVFRFVATVKEKDEDIKEHLKYVGHSHPTINNIQTKDVSSLTEKIRAKAKLFSRDNRLKVVNCFRAIHHDEEQDESDQSKAYTVVDVESILSNCVKPKDSSSLPSLSTKKEKYVYDLYYTNDPCDYDDLQLEHSLSAHDVSDAMLFGNYISDREDEDENQMDDEDDSNDENNWRNDYPDENSSIDEDDMRSAVRRLKTLNLSGDYSSDLSSDEYDEDVIYCTDYRDNYYFDLF